MKIGEYIVSKARESKCMEKCHLILKLISFWVGLHESETIYNISVIIVSLLEILENLSLVLVFSENIKSIIALSWNSWSYWSYPNVQRKASRLFEKLEVHVEE